MLNTKQWELDWAKTVTELQTLSQAMSEINKTPTKEQTPEQQQALKTLRGKCVAIHNLRIELNIQKRKRNG